nr:tumor necrosis factor ligand superfamily member 13B-like [Pseudochaenichthys georgianus]
MMFFGCNQVTRNYARSTHFSLPVKERYSLWSGNITVIPWTVSAQQGNTISQKENRIVAQEDGFDLVFGQVLLNSPSTVLGHIIRSWAFNKTWTTSTELLRCLQEMADETPANTCYTGGIVQLHQDDELELVIPNRQHTLISMEAESTFLN